MYGTKVICYSPESRVEEKNFYRIPAVDIYETEKGYTLQVNMPGVKKEDIKVHLEDQHLHITGKVSHEDSGEKKYLLREIRRGDFQRRFKVAETIDLENLHAAYENGVLTIELQKKPETQPKTIVIK